MCGKVLELLSEPTCCATVPLSSAAVLLLCASTHRYVFFLGAYLGINISISSSYNFSISSLTALMFSLVSKKWHDVSLQIYLFP